MLLNVVVWVSLEVHANTRWLLYHLIMPYGTSPMVVVVGTWVTMLLHLAAVHVAACTPSLLGLGVAADVQRLALGTLPAEITTAERLMVRAVQLLSNICVVFQVSSSAAQQWRASPLKPPRHLEDRTKGSHPAFDTVAIRARA